MTIPSVANANYPTPEEVLNQCLADIRFGYERQGVTVNVSTGSELFVRSQAYANRISILVQNNRIALADVSPIDAVGAALEEISGVYGISKRPAIGASGFVIATGLGVVTIPDGFQCTAPDGNQYQTVAAVTADVSAVGGVLVLVNAVSPGKTSDQTEDTILTWDSAAIGALTQTCVVGPGGIDGGRDADDDEALRRRLLDRLGFPGVGGNWSQVRQWARAAHASVQDAFVYNGARGPASYDVAVTGDASDRTVGALVIATAATALVGNMPGFSSVNVTTVSEQEIDVLVDLTLPLPVNTGGAGGGWRDATPWPSTAETGVNVFAAVTAVNAAARTVTVNSTASDTPTANEHVGIWNPTGGTELLGEMVEFQIQTVGGGVGAYVLTLFPGPPMTFIAIGMYLSAGAHKLLTYADEFMQQMRLTGPGEKTTSADILPRARRRPGPDEQWASSITTLLLANVIGKHREILNASYAGRFDTGTTTTRTSPAVPAVASSPPRILTLRHLSFRRQVT